MSKSSFKILEKPPIEESYDYAEQVRRQIERVLEASAIQDEDIREGTYKACILALGNLVPFDDRDDKFIADLEACTEDEQYYLYRKFGGRKMGTPENPVTHISPGPPITTIPKGTVIVVSPTLETRKVTDWDEYFTVLFNKYVELKVTVRRGSYAG